MSVYSSIDVYPSMFDEVLDDHHDIENVDDHVWTPEEIFNMQFLISEKLADKGYHAVNLCLERVDGELQQVLEFDHTEVCRFARNMKQLGYPCEIVFAHKRRYRWVVFKNHTPMDLLHVYHHLDVIA